MFGRLSGTAVTWLVTWQGRLAVRWRRDERGDVPGWVMIVVMTAGLVVILGAIAQDELGEMLEKALNSVTGD
jgi:hypothetical protein